MMTHAAPPPPATSGAGHDTTGYPPGTAHAKGGIVTHGHLKDTLKHGSIYSLAIVLSRMISFIMIPVYTRVLTPEDYGILELLSMTTDVMAMLTGLGLGWAITRYYYYYDDPRRRGEVVSTALVMTTALFGTATALSMPIADRLSAVLLGTPQHTGLVRLALVSFFLSSLLETPTVYLRAKQASLHAAAIGLVRLSLVLGLNILLVVVLRLGVEGVLLSTIVTSALLAVYLLVITLRETGLRVSRPIMWQLVRYGAPLVAWSVGSFVLHYSDRYFLRAYDGLASVGLYSLAYRFAMLAATFVGAPFGQIWGPKALQIEKNEGANAQPILREISSYYNIALVGCALGLSLFSGDVLRLIAGQDFHAAEEPIPLLCLAIVLFDYRHISQLGATIRERSDLIAYSTAVAAGIVTVLNFALIPRWGMMGAAAATVTAFAAEFFFMSALSARVYSLNYPVREVLRPLCLALIIYGASRALLGAEAPLAVSVPIKGLAFAAFLFLLPTIGAISVSQRAILVKAIRDPAWGLRELLRGS